jgi:hypothetical protein
MTEEPASGSGTRGLMRKPNWSIEIFLLAFKRRKTDTRGCDADPAVERENPCATPAAQVDLAPSGGSFLPRPGAFAKLEHT